MNKYYMIAISAMMLLASCSNDVQLTTVVNEDGSCEREICFRASEQMLKNEDSLHLGNGLGIDAKWTKTWGIKGSDERHPYPMSSATYDSIKAFAQKNWNNVEDTVRVYASRKYENVSDLHTDIKALNGEQSSKASLDKSFKWFYTDYTFTETFERDNSLYPLPVTDYATTDEVSFWCTGQPNLTEGCSPYEAKSVLDDIESKMVRWFFLNYIYIQMDAIAANYDLAVGASMDKDAFIASRKDFLAQIPSNDILQSCDNCAVLFRDYYHTEAYNSFFDDESDVYKKAHTYKPLADIENSIAGGECSYSLVMPGEVTDTGCGLLSEEGAIIYKLDMSRLIPGKYVITATSRVTNIWAFGVTALVILVAIVSFFRKRNDE